MPNIELSSLPFYLFTLGVAAYLGHLHGEHKVGYKYFGKYWWKIK